jgi:hypothetical protein
VSSSLGFVFEEIKLVPKTNVAHLLVFSQRRLQVGRLGSICKATAIVVGGLPLALSAGLLGPCQPKTET